MESEREKESEIRRARMGSKESKIETEHERESEGGREQVWALCQLYLIVQHLADIKFYSAMISSESSYLLTDYIILSGRE